MKKLSLLFALLAGIAVMTGCKKDQDVVTLQAVIDQNTKAYFGTSVRPYWDTDDQVCIMGAGYSSSITCTLSHQYQTYAKIEGVQSSSNGYYCAIYPPEAARTIGIPTDGTGATQATILFPSQQKYIFENGRQRINMPMGAITNNRDKTFHFKNLCSILRLQMTNNVKVRNEDGTYSADYIGTIKVKRVTIYAYGGYLSGYADVTLTPDGVTGITMDGPDDPTAVNVLSLYREDGGYIKEDLAQGASASFDVVVPPFQANSLNIEFEMYKEVNGEDVFIGNSDATIENPDPLGYNNIVTIALDVQGYEKPDYAYLAEGQTFNSIIRNNLLQGHTNVTNLTFNPSWNNVPLPPEPWDQATIDDSYGTAEDWSAWKIVSAEDSPLKIYAHIVSANNPDDETEEKILIASRAKYYYADENSSGMFQNLTTIKTMHWNVSEDSGFQTEDVTDMSYMFAGCTSLTTLQGIELSNFSNVETMAHMFEGCTTLGSVSMNPVNTHNLRDDGMVAMFKNCSSIQTINISTVTTNRVTNMSELFAGCKNLTSINMSQFVISSNTNIDNMCYQLNYNHIPPNAYNVSGNPCYITCKRSVWNTMKGQATTSTTDPIYGSPDPTTGFTVTVIYDRNVIDD